MSWLSEAQTPDRNKVDELREWVMPLVNRLSSFPEVEGVAILSGTAKQSCRPVADSHSDVDLALFLNTPMVPENADLKRFTTSNQTVLPQWLPDYEFIVPVGQEVGREVNIHQLLYSYESRDDVEWPEAKKEAYAYTSDVVFDRVGRIQRLIQQKTRYDFSARNARFTRLAVQVRYSGWENPRKQLKRGLTAPAHDLVNEAVDLLVEALYLLNNRYRPHRKWRLMIARELAWKPAEFVKKIDEAMLVLAFDEADVQRRTLAVQEIWAPMLTRALECAIIPADYDKHLATHISLNRQLRCETLADILTGTIEALGIHVNWSGLRSFIDFAVIESPQHFLEVLGDDHFECPAFLSQDWLTLKLNRRVIQDSLTSRHPVISALG